MNLNEDKMCVVLASVVSIGAIQYDLLLCSRLSKPLSVYLFVLGKLPCVFVMNSNLLLPSSSILTRPREGRQVLRSFNFHTNPEYNLFCIA